MTCLFSPAQTISVCRTIAYRLRLLPTSDRSAALSWHRALYFGSMICIFVNHCTATEIDQWQVNSWGDPAPVFAHQRVDGTCAREGTRSTSFRLVSRGNGDAEITLPGVLEPHKAYRFTVWLRSSSPAPVEVFFRRDASPYETTAIRSTKISGWTQVSLSGIHASSEPGSVRIAVRQENVALCINSAALASVDPSTVGANNVLSKIDDRFFGVHLNRLGRHNGWPTFNPGTLRLWDTGTTWAQLQPVNAPIDWQRNPYAQRLDYYVRHGLAKKPGLQFIYTLGMTPSWAGGTHPRDCNKSSYGPSVCKKPQDAESWRQHVRALGLRYKGAIRVWEIWNEADVWVHWDQTPEDLIQFVKIAAQELKGIDPNNQIIGPNITGGGLRFLSQFLAAGGGAYLDGVSIHAYIGRVPELSLAQIRNLRQLLHDTGLSEMPIWNTETAVSCNSLLENCKAMKSESPPALSGTNALAQGLIGNAALGVKSFVYYTWEGASLEYGNLPLVEPDYQVPTKAGLLLWTLKAWLGGSQARYRTANQGGLSVVEVIRGSTAALVLWSSGPPITYDLTEFATGGRYMRASGGGSYPLIATHLAVGPEPIMVYTSLHSTTD